MGPLIAAIPFFQLGVYWLPVPGLGSIPIDPWATLVCLGCIIGLEVGRYRTILLGIEVKDIVDGAVFSVACGFLMAHVVTVVAYHPERLAEDGIWAILRFWEGFSSFGGFIGAVLGSLVFYRWIRPRDYLRHADIIVYGFATGWFFGRLGCGVVHDHIGAVTTFPLGMWFPPNHAAGPAIRHELGLYEAAFMLVMIFVFWRLGKKDRPPGFFLGMFATMYAPVRFGLDFLRNTDLKYQDARYLHLTPAQWGMILLFGVGLTLLATRDYKNFKPWALDGGPDQEKRASSTVAEPGV